MAGRIAYDDLARVSGSLSSVGTSEEVTLQMPQKEASRSESWQLIAFAFVQTGGSAAYAPTLGEAASYTGGGVQDRMTIASTTSGTKIDSRFDPPIPLITDSNGRLYFRPTFASGSQSADYVCWFRKAG